MDVDNEADVQICLRMTVPILPQIPYVCFSYNRLLLFYKSTSAEEPFTHLTYSFEMCYLYLMKVIESIYKHTKLIVSYCLCNLYWLQLDLIMCYK